MKKLYKAITEYTDSQPARFHMPGHKGKLSSYDITELSFSDDLHAPTAGIKSIQEQAALTYSADSAFLLVNGSSGGITAFLTALSLMTGKRRPRVALGRDAHRSAVSACALSGAEVLGIDVRPGKNGAPGAITAEDIEEALSGRDVDAICITSPNYYGVCADVRAISAAAKRHGALLFVDSAHGAHFPFSNRLPDVPTHADAFVVSTHKTLYAYNQTGLLLANSAIPNDVMQSALSMIQTTSPSYPLMLSIADAIERAGGGEWNKHIDRILTVRGKLRDMGVSVLSHEDADKADITRLVISAQGLSDNGYVLYGRLEERGIYAEMADMANVVLITSPADEDEWYERLYDALIDFRRYFSGKSMADSGLNIPMMSHDFADVRGAWMESDTEWVRIDSAEGMIAAGTLGVYPPGTTLLFPGERVSREAIYVLKEYGSVGAKVFGVRDGCIKVVKRA